MPIRNSYSDTSTGKADIGIRSILVKGEDDDENVRKLRKVLLNIIKNELTPRQKEIIMLYYFRRTDIVTIGKQLGISSASVSLTMKRARLKMYRILKYYV